MGMLALGGHRRSQHALNPHCSTPGVLWVCSCTACGERLISLRGSVPLGSTELGPHPILLPVLGDTLSPGHGMTHEGPSSSF